MWKKSESEQPQPEYTPKTNVNPLKERATIGSSILIKGDLSGEEDLLVQGRVEGRIELKQYNLTIGEKGRVKADIYAKIISVEGHVEGNLFGEEKITIRKPGQVKGNLVAPRVSLEEGSNFKGSIDMDASASRGDAQRPAASKNLADKSGPVVQRPDTGQKVGLGLSTDPVPSRGQ